MTHTHDRLAGLCEHLMTWRAETLPCSHDLLAQFRDEARDGVFDDDSAAVLLRDLLRSVATQADRSRLQPTKKQLLNAKISGQNAGNAGIDNERK